MRIDLQVHSTYSDGYLTPSQLVDFLAKQKMKVAALTDHNTVSGLDEFRSAARKFGIKAINGLELYVRLNGRRMNLLWYNFDPARPELHDLLRETQQRRRAKIRKILEKLNKKSFEIKVDKTLDKYNHYVPVNRIVDELMATKANVAKVKKELKNFQPREDQLIRYFFYNKKFGSLRESYVAIERVIKLRQKVGGQLILCHPGKHYTPPKELFIRMKKLGIDGLELLSPHHSVDVVMYLQSIAKELNYIETGGSDFHRFESGNNPIKDFSQYFFIDSDLLRGVEKIIG